MTEIPFEMTRQGCHAHWCWAAVAASVWQRVHGEPKRMCELACDEVGAQCCDVPTPSECEVDASLADVLYKWQLRREPVIVGALPLAADPGEPSVETEIAAGHPIAVGINFGGVGHYCVIVGCDTAARKVSVLDPFYDPSPELDYDTFVTAYQTSGTWFETYLLP